MLLPSVRPVEELARAALLHDVCARPPRQLAETVRAIDDRVSRHLSVAEHKVAICEQLIKYSLFQTGLIANQINIMLKASAQAATRNEL